MDRKEAAVALEAYERAQYIHAKYLAARRRDTVKRWILLIALVAGGITMMYFLTGCADTASRHTDNTQKGDQLFQTMRSEAKEGSQDWLRERLGRIREQYDAKAIDAKQYTEETEKALKTYFERADNREQLTDDEALWLCGMIVESTSIPGSWGMIGNFGEQTWRGIKRIGAKIDDAKKQAPADSQAK